MLVSFTSALSLFSESVIFVLVEVVELVVVFVLVLFEEVFVFVVGIVVVGFVGGVGFSGGVDVVFPHVEVVLPATFFGIYPTQ